MKLYHGTSVARWEQIKEEGVLWGKREIQGFTPSRCTYFAVSKEEAKQYGEVVLEADYEPGSEIDNYTPGCWQVRVYGAIPLSKIRQVK